MIKAEEWARLHGQHSEEEEVMGTTIIEVTERIDAAASAFGLTYEDGQYTKRRKTYTRRVNNVPVEGQHRGPRRQLPSFPNGTYGIIAELIVGESRDISGIVHSVRGLSPEKARNRFIAEIAKHRRANRTKKFETHVYGNRLFLKRTA